MSNIIEPKVLKGFRDHMPAVTIPRQAMIRKLEDVFSSFGFVPIDTPALEYAEILVGKGSTETDKQMFRFTDQGGRDVALRFDLTVPLARYVAAHINELGTPFKRYHVANVWRAEKPQRGRYREFTQCDFDIIGTESIFADAEIITVIHSALSALGVNHQIRVNNRLLLGGLVEHFGAAGHQAAVLRAIDKLDKQGQDAVREELMREANLNGPQIDQLFQLFTLSKECAQSHDRLFAELAVMCKGSEMAARGLGQLQQLSRIVKGAGISEKHCLIDLTIARGLDYYTGTVFEASCTDLPNIGSIGAGGRYDDLASRYCNRKLPGVGGSVGLDRVLAALEELGRLDGKASTADLLVTLVDEASEIHTVQIAAELRRANLRVELFPEHAKLGNQLKYADKKGIRFAVIAGERETAQNVVNVKDLVSGKQHENIQRAELPQFIQKLLNS